MKHCFETAYAKINLTLDVLGKRADGYHELCMVMQTVSLCDRVAVRTGCGGDGIGICMNLPFIPADERNIAIKAARAFIKAVGINCDGIKIVIEKRIPVAAGLAGGSSDAAAVLRALNFLYGTRISMDELCQIGLTVGADVPFCLRGGTMLAEGVGERLTRLPPLGDCYIVLVKPAFGMSTPRVFGAFCMDEVVRRPDTRAVINGLSSGDLSAAARGMYNVLEEPAARQYSEIIRIRQKLKSFGAIAALMSGSGSTMFGIFENERKARGAYEQLKKLYPDTFYTRQISEIDHNNPQ